MNELATIPINELVRSLAICVAGLFAFSVCFVAIFDSKKVREMRERGIRSFGGWTA